LKAVVDEGLMDESRMCPLLSYDWCSCICIPLMCGKI
jgi:hypothetical protein